MSLGTNERGDGWIVKTVTAAPVSTLSIGAADGLPDGDSARWYEFICDVVFNSAIAAILLQPNGISANMHSVTVTSVNGAAPATGPNGDSRIGITTAAGFAITIEGRLRARRGTGARRFVSRASSHTAALTNNLDLFAGVWNDDATNIVSVDFTASAALGIGIGSEFAVRPLVR